MNSTPERPLLQLDGVDISYGTGRKEVVAVRDVSFSIAPGKTLGLVGESGSGKSTIGRAVLGLARASRGRILFDGEDITRTSRRTRRRLSQDLQVVFQDPRSSLNEAKRVGEILVEPMLANRLMTTAQAKARAADLLERVGLGADAARKYPGAFSGGQRQRIAIARSLMPSPRLVICDEPVSALDLSVQAQIVNTFRSLQRETGVSYLFIAHDLAVVRLLSDDIAVMSRGGIVELGNAEQVYTRPNHEYTKRLLAAEPYPDPAVQRERRKAWTALRTSATPAVPAGAAQEPTPEPRRPVVSTN